MDALNPSLFHHYSIGIVAENAQMSSHEILVTPIEHLSFLDGEIRSNPTQQSAQGVDASGRNYTVNVIHDNCIQATWLDISGSNRITPPNVRRGERVSIYRYGDADKFYWSALGLDNKLRKLETVTHAYSGTQDNSDDELTATNSYLTEVSTHKKTITVSTSKKNGEVAGYTVQIDAGRGLIHIQDDQGQVFELDTTNHRMTLSNADQSQVRLDKQNISITCKDTLAINATKLIKIQTKDLQLTAETVEANVSKTWTETIGQSKKVDCPTTVFTGSVEIQKTLKVDQTTEFDGLVTAQQGLNSPSVPIHGPTDTLN